MGAVAHVLAVDPVPARSQMGSSLGFHIILACFGIAFAAVTMTVEWIGIRRGDAAALLLARRWSKVMAVLVAVGAVSGTVLSYEMGLLWPGLMGRFGAAIGFPFSVEGIFFFLEAIFVGVYLYGWRRLSPWAHWWSGMPIVVAGVLGAMSVVAANSWMNSPAGYTLRHGKITSVDPVSVFFNASTPYETAHMVLAAYMVTGFVVAGVYAVGLLRGRRDRYHRLGFAVPFTLAGIAAPLQVMMGDIIARFIAHNQPVKFAAMEYVSRTTRDAPEWVGGILINGHVYFGASIPAFDSILAGFSPHTRVIGWDSVPAGAAASARHAHPPELRSDGGPRLLPLRAGGVAGLVVVVPPPAAGDGVVPGAGCPQRRGGSGRDGGGMGRHRGRPPAVDRLPRHAGQRRGHPVERGPGHAGGNPRPVRDLDGGLDRRSDDHVTAVAAGTTRRRGGRAGAVWPPAGQGFTRRAPGTTGRAPGILWRAGRSMNPSPEAVAVATILFVVIAAYALFGGADFGGGIWDLLAGSAERGAAPRALIDESITPVWEANHVWLIFILVLLWTAFPPAFAAIMTALFVPLSLSLLGIVLRGVGFAFRHTAQRLRTQQFTGALFAASSLITPFFMGTVVGAVATGQVPVHPAGNVLAAWTSPTAILTGFLFVAACAYVSAVFLVVEARQRGHQDLVRYFSLRATAAGVVTGALAGGTFAELSVSSTYVFDRLTGIALPLVAISIAAGIAVLGMLWLRWYHAVGLRVTAAIAVATVVWGWGLAQYPYLFPTSLPLAAGSAPTASLVALFVVAGLAALLVAPGFALLYYLQQRGMLAADETDADLRLAAQLEQGLPGQPAPAPAPAGTRTTRALVLAMLAIRAIKNVFSPTHRP